jgi:hypothetical protein
MVKGAGFHLLAARMHALLLAGLGLGAFACASPPNSPLGSESTGTPTILMRLQPLPEDGGEVEQLVLDVRNTSDAACTVRITVACFGFDQRRVREPLGTLMVGAGEQLSLALDARSLPLQSVSHSSELVFEGEILDGPAAGRSSPQTLPVYYHFDPAYEHVTAYRFDTMVADFGGGGLGDDLSALEGRIRLEGDFQDIGDLVRTDPRYGGFPGVIPLGPYYVATPPGDVMMGPEPGAAWYSVRVAWRTHFVDAPIGDYATTPGEQEVPAAFARAEIRKVSPGQAIGDPDSASQPVWSGWLDEFGAVSFNPEGTSSYVIKVSTEFRKAVPDGAGTKDATSAIHYFDDDGEDTGLVTHVMSFFPGPKGSILPPFADLVTPWQVTNNVAATMSQLFTTQDSGLFPGADYHVNANIGCNNPFPGMPPTDSCAGWIGPAEIPGSDKPGNILWKFVIAHEIGHDVQHWLMLGVPDAPYDQDFSPTCGCAHVEAANGLHCLQSLEWSSAASVEGFAHFVAAKIWNGPAGGGSTEFGYYKEFRKDDGTVAAPPFVVDCAQPVNWRDNHCFHGELGVEYDWLQFYWAINMSAPQAERTTMMNLRDIYLAACTPGYCIGDYVAWIDVATAATQFHAGQPAKLTRFLDSADACGVDADQF